MSDSLGCLYTLQKLILKIALSMMKFENNLNMTLLLKCHACCAGGMEAGIETIKLRLQRWLHG